MTPPPYWQERSDGEIIYFTTAYLYDNTGAHIDTFHDLAIHQPKNWEEESNNESYKSLTERYIKSLTKKWFSAFLSPNRILVILDPIYGNGDPMVVLCCNIPAHWVNEKKAWPDS